MRHLRALAYCGSWEAMSAVDIEGTLTILDGVVSKIARYICMSQILGFAFSTFDLDLLGRMFDFQERLFPTQRGEVSYCFVTVRVALVAGDCAMFWRPRLLR